MAGLQYDENGNPLIQFVGPDGKRRKMRLTGMGKREAQRFADKLTDLRRFKKLGIPLNDELVTWVTNIDDDTAAKLAEYGLLPRREPATAPDVIRLGALLDRYVSARNDVKPGTLTNWGHTKRCLLAFFTAAKPVAEVTAGDARDFERYLRTTARENRYDEAEETDGLKPATVRKRISHAKQFFRYAVEHRLIAANPFEGLKSAATANRARDFFVTRDMAAKVLEACPDNEWRLLFTLARFGGLRCPSEHLALKLADVDLPAGRMIVHSPKTERHEGKESRAVPIFPELRPYLEKAWDDAATGQVYVINRYRDASVNLRTQLERIIKRAGLDAWPKLWQNLRASRATELAAEFPQHVAAAWLGHSTAVASKHYWQVTDADFTKATGAPAVQAGAFLAHSGAVPDALGCSADQGRTPKEPRRTMGNTVDHRGKSKSVTRLACEQVASSPGNLQTDGTAGASLGAFGADRPEDCRLARVIEAWPTLPENVRCSIVAAVDAVVSPGEPN